MKDVNLKILSLFVAILLFLYVHSQSNSSIVALVVPVEIKNLPANKMILLPRTRQAQVTIKGPSFVVRDLAISAMTFRVSMPVDISNQYTVRLNEKTLPIPPSVEVLSIEPAELELIFDDVIEAEVPVVVPRIGKLPEGYNLVSQKTIPSRVVVKGPKTDIQGLRRVESDPVDFREVTDSLELELDLRNPGKYSEALTKTVQYKAEIKSITSEKTFKDLIVKVVSTGASENKFELSSEKISVEVTGPKKRIQKLAPSEIEVFLEIPEDFSQSELQLPVQVRLPENVELVLATPEMVTVKKKKH